MTKTNIIYSAILLIAVCLLVWQNCQKRFEKEEPKVQKELKSTTPQDHQSTPPTPHKN